jgi:hypothetical protein
MKRQARDPLASYDALSKAVEILCPSDGIGRHIGLKIPPDIPSHDKHKTQENAVFLVIYADS